MKVYESCFSRRCLLGVGGALALTDGLSGRTLASAQHDPRRLTEGLSDLEAWIARKLGAAGVMGAAVSVAKGGTILWEQGFGFADVASGALVQATTPFGLASVTKPFVTAAVMASALAGKIDIDAAVEDALPFCLPKSGFAAAGVTPRRLGSHASGLPSFFQLAKVPGQPPPTRALMHDFGRLAYAPGEIYEYSNIGFQLLGAALAHVEQMPFEEAIHHRIIRPMGLQDSFFLADASERTGLSTRYAADGTPIPYYTTLTPASGELCSSVRDLSLFAANLMNFHRGNIPLFSHAATHAMRRPVFQAQDGRFTAFGWMGFYVEGELMLIKNGSDPGVAAQLTLMPERGVSIAVVANTSNDDFASEVGEKIATLFVPSYRRQNEDLPSRALGRQARSWFNGNWRGIATNEGLTLSVEIDVEPDKTQLRIDGAPGVKMIENEMGDGAFVGRCAGRMGGSAGTGLEASLQFRLLAHADRLVGRILERRPNSTLPYIVDLARL